MRPKEDRAKEIAQLDAEIAALKKELKRYTDAGHTQMVTTVENQISALQRLREKALANAR